MPSPFFLDFQTQAKPARSFRAKWILLLLFSHCCGEEVPLKPPLAWPWSYNPAHASALGTIPRLWERGQLNAAYAVASYPQMQSLVQKLQTGQPITLVALGTSISEDFSGCFHSSKEVLARASPRHRRTPKVC